jgi:chromate transporter
MYDSAHLPTLSQQLYVWTALGLQSFGGGTATLSLIRRAVVDRYAWVSDDEFTRYWALVLLVPGINLLGLTILIGRKTGGAKGVALALCGLLIPSVNITILLTALYAHVEHSRLVEESLSGLIPATIGIGLYTGWQIALPGLKKCAGRGWLSFAIAITLFLGSAAMEACSHWPVALILLTAGAIGAVTGFAGTPNIKDRS